MNNAGFAARTVLIADDERMLAEALEQMISHCMGCQVVTRHTGDEALEFLLNNEVDVFVADMLMPGCHGIDLVEKAKEIQPDCDVMVMTAHPNEFPYIDVISAGASDFIAKPHSTNELCAKILRLFRERALREEVARERQRAIEDNEKMRLMRSAQSLAEEKYGLLFELSMNGMLIVDSESRIIEDVNKAFCELCGREKMEILGKVPEELLVDEDRGRFGMGMQAIAGTGRGTLGGICLLHSSGNRIWLDVSMTHIHSEEDSLILMACKDVTEQRSMQDRLVQMASTDELTGLFNQRAFYSRIGGITRQAERDEGLLTLVFIDIDNFKQCNDRHGHQTGDALLRRIGKLIREGIRDHDEGFRYGGDEFVVVLKKTGKEGGILAAERIRRSFLEGERFGTSMSFGVAEFAKGMDADALIKAADEALYAAKSSGKDAIHVA